MGKSNEEMAMFEGLIASQEVLPTFEGMREMDHFVGSGGKTTISLKALIQWEDAGNELPSVNGVD